jgi:hypothetical protein
MSINVPINMYKGKYFKKNKIHKGKKVIVFDMDETIGSFIDLEILWKLTQIYSKNKKINFNQLLDLYPEFLRYGIISILEYLHIQKKNKKFHKLYIYTNNQGGPNWVQMIIDYIDYKLNTTNLFDQVINTFMINDIQIEPNRTTMDKTHDDFINCAMLPSNTSILFVDDKNYQQMKKDKIYYIQPKPYIHHMTTHDIANRFIYSNLTYFLLDNDIKKQNFKSLFITESMKYNIFKSVHDININLEEDILISRKIMYHLKEYLLFLNKKNKTYKKRSLQSRFTRKR